MKISVIKTSKNKQGFTLVELLASVAVFALIMTPLIHSFVTSSNISRKSHTLADATLACTNIIETFKSMSTDSVTSLIAAGINPFASGVVTAGDTRTFNISDYSAGMSSFDVRVTLDSDIFSDINETYITNYSPMDGVFAQSTDFYENPDILAALDFEFRTGTDFEQVIENYTRTITMKVHTNIADDEVRITVTYHYTFNYLVYERAYEIYREKYTPAEKSIYMFYQPFYFGTDLIEIDNTAGINLKVFIVKQDEIPYLEAGYDSIIKQTEPENITGDEYRTRIFSNSGGELRIYRSGSFWYDSGTLTGELVSRSQIQRMFNITVEVFSTGELESGGRALISIDAALLN
jgi:prepilin-type N-terminal cleavage/methylation domain-containing protein